VVNKRLTTTKDYVRKNKLFLQNKANSKPIQTQYKPNTKPIQTQFKANTKPIQSQFKPKQTQSCPPSVWRDRAKTDGFCGYFSVRDL